jgi:7-cyano-7-deazaguanine synthase
MKTRDLAVCLVSGGLDSCVTAAIAAEMHDLAFLHVGYGQRTQSREFTAFKDISKYYDVRADKQLVVDISYLKVIGGSALTDSAIDVPDGDLSNKEIPVTYVPFRNAHLLAIATSWAEVIGAEHIYIGAVEEDSSGYPDCRASFFSAYNLAIAEGTKSNTDILVKTPLLNYSKKQVVQLGMILTAPLEVTWSCYQNEHLACRKCDSCLLRLKGFKEAGFNDPARYVDLDII